MEEDIFRIFVSLDDAYLAENTTQFATQTTQSTTQSATQFTQSTTQSVTAQPEKAIIELIRQESSISQKQMAERLCLNLNTLKYHMRKMQEKGMIERIGSSRKGTWTVK